VRLTEQRSRAQERRAELALTAQGGAAVVAELEAPVREHPVREESWRLLALALYDAGRQGDALAALRRAREVLTDELGLNPGEVLNADSGYVRIWAELAAPARLGRSVMLVRLGSSASVEPPQTSVGHVPPAVA
jgi:DNA-binding SARP family transcriptional activator